MVFLVVCWIGRIHLIANRQGHKRGKRERWFRKGVSKLVSDTVKKVEEKWAKW